MDNMFTIVSISINLLIYGMENVANMHGTFQNCRHFNQALESRNQLKRNI